MAFVKLSNLAVIVGVTRFIGWSPMLAWAKSCPRIASRCTRTNESPSATSATHSLDIVEVAAVLREHCAASAARRASIPSFHLGTSPVFAFAQGGIL